MCRMSHQATAELASIHELAALSVHESAPEVSSDHESAPVPPEVAAPAAELPKGAASSYELSACPATTMEATSELSPCHVTAQEANHELSARHVIAKKAGPILSCPATFKGATPELSALPWGFLLSSALLWWSSASPWRSSDSSVPLLGSLLLSTLLYWSPAPPWLPALSPPVFHNLPLLHDPGPLPLPGPGSPSHPLFPHPPGL
ncbi:hypothetical protein M9458_000212, partial [Cirrhinus mrigala]